MVMKQDVSTRKMVLTLLKTKGTLSVSELSKHLHITEMAVRRHLNTLERDGLIESKLVRQAMGRPTNQYFLSKLSDDLFPKNYHRLTLDLLDELESESGESSVTRLFEGRKQKLLDKHEHQMKDKSIEEKIEALAEIQNDGGYMVEWEQDEEGNFEFNEFNCPISQVAYQYEQACQCELTLFKQLLNTEVERTECLAKGGMKCTYKIQAPNN